MFPYSLRERSQVKQLVQYIVQEAPDGASKERILKYAWAVKNSLD